VLQQTQGREFVGGCPRSAPGEAWGSVIIRSSSRSINRNGKGADDFTFADRVEEGQSSYRQCEKATFGGKGTGALKGEEMLGKSHSPSAGQVKYVDDIPIQGGSAERNDRE